MYLVDTNVISELRKRSAHRNSQVADWVRSVPIAELYLSAITIYEIEVGIRRISRRDEVQGRGFENGSNTESFGNSEEKFCHWIVQ